MTFTTGDAWGNFLNRGGIPKLPEGIEAYYSDATAGLIAESRSLRVEWEAAQTLRDDYDERLQAAPGEHTQALAEAARAGKSHDLPDDPVPGLNEARGEAQRRMDALTAALRSVSYELVAALEMEADAAWKLAYADAVAELPAADKAIERAQAAVAKADAPYGLARWTQDPSIMGQPLPTLDNLGGRLEQARAEIARLRDQA